MEKTKMECEICNKEKEGKFYQRVQTDNKIVCHSCYWEAIFLEVQKELDKDDAIMGTSEVSNE